ncbi:MAG TPA: FdhF/YdeP family oxidoreductase [Burkholderiaceae bacterium]
MAMDVDHEIEIAPYEGPVGGWGSMGSLAHHVRHHKAFGAIVELPRQNKVDGFACVSCAWAKPANAHRAEFCENGAKATFAELTSRRIGAPFFAAHRLEELRTWPDHDLEFVGRLTEPLRYDAETDRYVPVDWDEAFAAIGEQLKALKSRDVESVVFYASGRASLEASYLYQLFARLYGNNNLPDSSNMCHESTSVGLKAAIGVPVGTVRLDDFAASDCLLFFGQNVGSNSPRMLHPLQEASERGVPIIVFNPLRERGLERFTNPQRPSQMLSGESTRIASRYHQVRAGGDIAAITGLCKVLLEMDDVARTTDAPAVIDWDFINEHTRGFDEFVSFVRQQRWADIEAESALSRAELTESARCYAKAKAVIGVYGMGLTQHKRGVDNVRMLVNLLLMRGNIGKPGAGPCPVRGHSNVQGQRTVGISEKPELVPLDKLAERYGFEPPRKKGINTVEVCEAVLTGQVKAFFGLGGNFVRAIPDHDRMEPAWRELELTVHVATKLNRSHLLPGRVSYLLPCLGRIERDVQDGVTQTVAVEDSTSCVHASRGQHAPASAQLLSEARIIAGIAKATLPPMIGVAWDAWARDYALIRHEIAVIWPKDFSDFDTRMHQPGGFGRNLAARERQWMTPSGKAEFGVPGALSAVCAGDGKPGLLRLITLRSNDQFNTTVYGYDDRLRGIEGTRKVLMLNAEDMYDLGLQDGDSVDLHAAAADGIARRVEGLRAIRYSVPRGCCAGYFPECNPVIALEQYAEQSKVPAAKSVPVRVTRAAAG